MEYSETNPEYESRTLNKIAKLTTFSQKIDNNNYYQQNFAKNGSSTKYADTKRSNSSFYIMHL